MEKVNPSDPSLIDIFDDTTGEFIVTIPKDDPPMAPGAADQFGGFGETDVEALASSPVVTGKPLAGPPAPPAPSAAPAPSTPKGYRAAPVAPPEGSHPAKEAEESEAPPPSLTPGIADALPDSIPGQEGGLVETQRQTSGMSPDAVSRYQQQVEGIADVEMGAALDEALAREIQLEERRKEEARLRKEVQQEHAKQAVEAKVLAERRKKIDERYTAVAAEEPDFNRAFPKGGALFVTFIGAIAGGMLQGLQGGSNPVLDALFRRLELDVKEQRLTQSEILKDMTRKLGSVDAAEDMLRAKQKELLLKEAEQRIMSSEIKAAPAQIDAFRSRMTAEIMRHKTDALSKLERDLTIQEVNAPSTPDIQLTPETYKNKELLRIANERGYKENQRNRIHAEWDKFNRDYRETAAGRSRLEDAVNAIRQFEETNDVAGLGVIAKYIPTGINAKDAVAVRQTLGAAVAGYLKDVSGTAVTEQEFERTLDYLQGKGDFDSVMTGLRGIEKVYDKLDEESRTSQPEFHRLRGTIRQMHYQLDSGRSQGRSEQAAMAGDPIVIPQTSRIAFVHNNPGNLMFAGQAGAVPGEPRAGGGHWAKFESAGDGLRALHRQVKLDADRGFNVKQFVEKYAPKNDGNNVDAYVEKLRRLTGADADTPLSEISPGALAFAVAAIESGARAK